MSTTCHRPCVIKKSKKTLLYHWELRLPAVLRNPALVPRIPARVPGIPITEDGNIEMTEGAPETPEILPYAFYPDQPPTNRQIIYQLCDIRCAKAQKLISENDGRVR